MAFFRKWLKSGALALTLMFGLLTGFGLLPGTVQTAEASEGGPFPYAKDGSTFGNYERILPRQKRGYYTEYTVKTPGAKNRGARRIVAGKGRTGDPATSGEYWYTADHYKSFARIVE